MIMRDRFDYQNVIVGRGAQLRFVKECAQAVAVALYNAGLWDGKRTLTVHSPCSAYKRMLRMEGSLRAILTPGVDYEVAAEDYGEPLIAEPRVVNNELVAITAVCADCGGQYDHIIERRWVEFHSTSFYPQEARCPVCTLIATRHFRRPDRMILSVQPVEPTWFASVPSNAFIDCDWASEPLPIRGPGESEPDTIEDFEAFLEKAGPGALKMAAYSMHQLCEALRAQAEATKLALTTSEVAAGWLRADAETVLAWAERVGLDLTSSTPLRRLRITLDHTAAGETYLERFEVCVAALQRISDYAPAEMPTACQEMYSEHEDLSQFLIDLARWSLADIAREALSQIKDVVHDINAAAAADTTGEG